jgi:hypothetical protein
VRDYWSRCQILIRKIIKGENEKSKIDVRMKTDFFYVLFNDTVSSLGYIMSRNQ